MLNLNLPRQFNAAEYFIDRNVAEGRGSKTAILFEDQVITYDRLMENARRHDDLGLGLADVCGKCAAIVPCSFTDPVKRASLKNL